MVLGKKNTFCLLTFACATLQRQEKKWDSNEWKVAQKWKLQNKQYATCLEGSRWTDLISGPHQSASDKHPQGTNTPLENTSANWTVNWKWTESKRRLTTALYKLCHYSDRTVVSSLRMMLTTVTVFAVYHFTFQNTIQDNNYFFHGHSNYCCQTSSTLIFYYYNTPHI